MKKDNLLFFSGRKVSFGWLGLLVFLMIGFNACKDDDEDLTPPAQSRNLAQVAENRSELSLFLTAVEQAGLSSALTNANSRLTVFAPNNQAFQAFLSNAGIELADLSQEQLQNVLQYHIVNSIQRSSSLTTGNVSSLNGGTIMVNVNGGVMLNGSASVVTADLEANNGIIHIIDEVLVDGEMTDPTIADLIGQEEDLSVLASILALPQFSGVVDAASNPESNLTLFAPTNTYFGQLLSALGKSSVNELPESVLTEIVTYHVVGESLASTDLQSMMYTTLQGEDLEVTLEGGAAVNGIAVSQADLMASNGYIHKISGVLLPADARAVNGTVAGIAYFNPNFTTLVAALREAELLEVLLEDGPFTVFAPTNAAFEAAGITDLSAFTKEELQAVLLYHVVAGNVTSDMLEAGAVTTASEDDIYVSLNNGVYINGSTMVSTADLAADNGVVHVVNVVLMPPSQNLAETVIASTEADMPEFTLLLRAVLRAGLADALSNDGPYTVFAPTDAAFEQAGFDAAAIDAATPEALQNILLYHVVPGRVFSSDLSNGDVSAANEGTITVNVENLSLTDERGNASGLNAEMLNILATNGVIHVIDAVLLPSE